MEILKNVAVSLVSIVIAMNLEILVLMAGSSPMKKVFEAKPLGYVDALLGVSSFIANLLGLALISFSFKIFAVKWTLAAFIVFSFIILGNAFMSLQKLEKDEKVQDYIVYSNEAYAIFSGRFFAVLAGFILLFMGVI